MAASSDLPRIPAQITPAWLAGVLRAQGLLPAGHVVGIKTEIIGEERGSTGVVARIAPEYSPDSQGAPRTIVAKFPLASSASASSIRRAVAKDSDRALQFARRCAREVAFYQSFSRFFPQIPACYFGHADPDNDECLLLLEDLSDGEPGDALAGCTVDEAVSVLDGLAALHARWWNQADIYSLDWLEDWSTSIPDRVQRYQEQVPIVVDRYRSMLDPHAAALISSLRDHLERILYDLASSPATLIHGDLHLDNVIFIQSDEGPGAHIIDWQGVARGAAMLDVAGFLVDSLSLEEFRQHGSEIMTAYHHGLLQAGVDNYAFPGLYEDFLRALVVRLAGTVGWLARTDMETLVGRERALVEGLFDPGKLFAGLAHHQVGQRLEIN